VFAKGTIAVVWVPMRDKGTTGTWEEESETSSAMEAGVGEKRHQRQQLSDGWSAMLHHRWRGRS